MTDEENQKIAELTTNAVHHPSEASIAVILDLLARMDKESKLLHNTADHLIQQFREDVGALAEKVGEYFETCRIANKLLKETSAQIFGADVKPPRIVDSVEKETWGTVAQALESGRSLLNAGKRPEN